MPFKVAPLALSTPDSDSKLGKVTMSEAANSTVTLNLRGAIKHLVVKNEGAYKLTGIGQFFNFLSLNYLKKRLDNANKQSSRGDGTLKDLAALMGKKIENFGKFLKNDLEAIDSQQAQTIEEFFSRTKDDTVKLTLMVLPQSKKPSQNSATVGKYATRHELYEAIIQHGNAGTGTKLKFK